MPAPGQNGPHHWTRSSDRLPVNPIFATVTQQNTPPPLLGRVFGALTTVAQAAIPIGADVRREPVAEPTDAQAAGQDGQPMIASRTTDIH
jgi:hypothetical protein